MFVTAPDFPIKAITWTLDRPSQSNVSAWTGTRVAVTNPWHGKWSAHVDLATQQDESTFRTIRSFFVRCRGSLNTFRLYATAGPQNANTGVTLSANAAAGATTISITGSVSPLLDGQFFTINGQLCCCTADQSGSVLTFEPPLRQAANSGTVVVTSRPYALVFLSSASFGWQVASWRQFGLSFDVEEAILETDGLAPESGVSPTLVDLSLSGSLTHGTASSGTLVGATAGSTFVLGGSPPAGLTIASTGGTYSWTGAGSGTGTFTITETNAGAFGSPHTTTINYSIGAGAGGTSTAGQPVGMLLILTKAA